MNSVHPGPGIPGPIHLFIVSPANGCTVVMISTTTKIRMIRTKLCRIGIGEKAMTDEAVLAAYSINQVGNLCPVPRTV